MSFDIKPVNTVSSGSKQKSAVNPFSEKIMGEWQFDKKASKGDTLWWVRKATITLAEVYAQDYVDPKTMKPSKIFGEITLVEKKAIDKSTSSPSIFQTIEPTEKSTIKEVF